jgi:hypothetical protein
MLPVIRGRERGEGTGGTEHTSRVHITCTFSVPFSLLSWIGSKSLLANWLFICSMEEFIDNCPTAKKQHLPKSKCPVESRAQRQRRVYEDESIFIKICWPPISA